MTWAEDVEAVHTEAAGVCDLYVIHSQDTAELLAVVVLGSSRATLLMNALGDLLGSIACAPRRQPALCICCPRALRGGKFLAGLVVPARPDATRALGVGLCEACAADPAQVEPRIIEGMRRLWPDARAVNVQHHAGHA